MTRYVIFLYFLLATSVSYGQLDLNASDSIMNALSDSLPTEINYVDVIEGPCEIIVCPIEHPPVTKNCVDLTDFSEQKECFIAEVKKLIEKEARIPRQPRVSSFTTTTYVSFVVNETAKMKRVEIRRSSSYHLPETMKSQAHLLDNEAVRVVSKLKFVEPPMLGTKPTRMMFTVPIKYSNPEK